MASGRRRVGVLYLLCLPRATLKELYEEHLRELPGLADGATHYLFGAGPYTFLEDHRWIQTPAKAREFGALTATAEMRDAVYASLPGNYRRIIDRARTPGVPFGPWFDQNGMYYKYESPTLMTVLLPKSMNGKTYFPFAGHEVRLTHVHDPTLKKAFMVSRVGPTRYSTSLISWTF